MDTLLQILVEILGLDCAEEEKMDDFLRILVENLDYIGEKKMDVLLQMLVENLDYIVILVVNVLTVLISNKKSKNVTLNQVKNDLEKFSSAIEKLLK